MSDWAKIQICFRVHTTQPAQRLRETTDPADLSLPSSVTSAKLLAQVTTRVASPYREDLSTSLLGQAQTPLENDSLAKAHTSHCTLWELRCRKAVKQEAICHCLSKALNLYAPYSPICKMGSKLQNTDNTKCWWQSRAPGTLIHCWWECRMVSHSGRQFGSFLQN